MEVFGIRLMGISAQNGEKLLFTLIFILLILLIRFLLVSAAQAIGQRRRDARLWFWMQQAVSLTLMALLIFGLLSIWFDDPERLAVVAGLMSAGLAFALQRVVTAIAGYFVILRNRVFTVGDRIKMGGVRGDVIALGFIQTTIMEMGQRPPMQPQDQAVWVRSRQFTGRIVTITNDRIFAEPVYNYTRDFPYLWEELSIAIPYDCDRERAERIVLEAATRHTHEMSEMSEEAMREFERKYFLVRSDLYPNIYYRLTENWLELTVRFVVREHGTRAVKDAISRDVLKGFDQAGIRIAPNTFAIASLPPLHLAESGQSGSEPHGRR